MYQSVCLALHLRQWNSQNLQSRRVASSSVVASLEGVSTPVRICGCCSADLSAPSLVLLFGQGQVQPQPSVALQHTHLGGCVCATQSGVMGYVVSNLLWLPRTPVCLEWYRIRQAHSAYVYLAELQLMLKVLRVREAQERSSGVGSAPAPPMILRRSQASTLGLVGLEQRKTIMQICQPLVALPVKRDDGSSVDEKESTDARVIDHVCRWCSRAR